MLLKNSGICMNSVVSMAEFHLIQLKTRRFKEIQPYIYPSDSVRRTKKASLSRESRCYNLIEKRERKLFGYEFKWGETSAKPPKLWLETYPQASFECINTTNYLSFIS